MLENGMVNIDGVAFAAAEITLRLDKHVCRQEKRSAAVVSAEWTMKARCRKMLRMVTVKKKIKEDHREISLECALAR